MQFDHRFLTDEYVASPYELYDDLRSTSPVYWSERFEAWILTRYDDVAAVIRDTDHFSNAERLPALLRQLPAQAYQRLSALSSHFSVGLVHSDPPDHTRLRALVSKAFTPRAVEAMRPRIEELVTSLLDEAGPSFDVVEKFAYPLPMIVVSDLVGIPAEDRDQFKAWSTQIFAFIGTGRPDAGTAMASQAALLELVEYFKQLFANKRQHPGDDLLSQLVLVEDQGNRLTEDELLSLCSTFVSAGHETTTSLIGSGARVLLENPDLRADLADDPTLAAPFVEEVLRAESPLQRDLKVAVADVELGGQVIRAGQLVYAMLGAANRDDQHFEAPGRFDIGRTRNRHLAFGFGAHFCLGAPLARLEGQMALAAFARRAGALELVGPQPTYRHDIALRALNGLHVKAQEGALRCAF